MRCEETDMNDTVGQARDDILMAENALMADVDDLIEQTIQSRPLPIDACPHRTAQFERPQEVIPYSRRSGQSISQLLLFYCNGPIGSEFLKKFYDKVGSLDKLMDYVRSNETQYLYDYIRHCGSYPLPSNSYGGYITMHIIGHEMVLPRRKEKLMLIRNLPFDPDVRALVMRMLFLELRYLRVA
jgi:hypothetical protein